MLIIPDNFSRDPGGFLVNQFGHAAVGLTAVFLSSVAWQEVAGEMPLKIALAAFVIGIYFCVVELAIQGWRKWDTIEDTIFVSYGVAMTLTVFSEAEVGSGLVVGAPADAMWLFWMFVLHLIAGVFWRVRNVLV